MKRSNSIYIILLIVLISSIVFLLSYFFKESVAEIVTISTAIISVGAIIYQLQKDHKIKKAEFIYSLNTTFNNDPDIKHIYGLLKKNRDEEYKFTPDEGRLMGDYMMFFDILYYLIEQRMLTLNLINYLFDYRFFLMTNNKYVQKYQLQYTTLQKPIINLYVMWYNYRLKHKQKELYEEDSFSNYKDFFIKDEKGYIKFNKERANIDYFTSK